MLRLASMACAVCLLAVPAFGEPVIAVGHHDLQPNTSGQPIEIYVSGGDAVEGLNFNIELDENPAAVNEPIIESLDILIGTIFQDNYTGFKDVDGPNEDYPEDRFPMFEGHTLVTDPDTTVSADGLLGTLLVDTTGVYGGEWSLLMKGTQNGATDFAGISADITNGTIRVVPEPAGMLLSLLVLGILAASRVGRNAS